MSAPTITWKETSSPTTLLDHGNVGTGGITAEREIEISHDSLDGLYDCSLYATQVSGIYSGSASAAADYSELMNWADQSTSSGFGGILLQFDKENLYPDPWASYSNKNPSNHSFVMTTSYGGSSLTSYTIPRVSVPPYSAASGIIPSGSSAYFKVKVQIPQVEDTNGIRQWDFGFKYTYTN